MIYVSLSTIPQRVKSLNETVKSLLQQTQKPDKIFINIPGKKPIQKNLIAIQNVEIMSSFMRVKTILKYLLYGDIVDR